MNPTESLRERIAAAIRENIYAFDKDWLEGEEEAADAILALLPTHQPADLGPAHYNVLQAASGKEPVVTFPTHQPAENCSFCGGSGEAMGLDGVEPCHKCETRTALTRAKPRPDVSGGLVADTEAAAKLAYNKHRNKWAQPEWDRLDLDHRASLVALANTFRDALLGDGADDAEDAAKWRALMSCERIRIMGRTLNYNHIGVEFWAKHYEAHPSKDYPQDECRAKLEEFVRRALPQPPAAKTGGENG